MLNYVNPYVSYYVYVVQCVKLVQFFSRTNYLATKVCVMKHFIIFSLAFCLTIHASTQSFLHTQGKEIVTTEEKPFVIKGINLGNWLVPEGYWSSTWENWITLAVWGLGRLLMQEKLSKRKMATSFS